MSTALFVVALLRQSKQSIFAARELRMLFDPRGKVSACVRRQRRGNL
jgi:hypothetical protein